MIERENLHMLQSIRDRTHGWIAGIIISLLILSFALWGIHSYFNQNPGDIYVAKVNSVEITQNQLNVTYERFRRETQNSQYDFSTANDLKLKELALESLISMEVLKQASIQQNYRISQNQINGLLESMPEFQVDNRFSVERFQQVLAATMYSANDFIELMKTSLLIDQPRLGLIFTSFALPYEVNNNLALVNQSRDIAYAIVPWSQVSPDSIKISSQRIADYYKTHQDEFRTPEQVNVEYLLLSVKQVMKNINPTASELKNYYTDNTSSFIEPAQWQLENILVPIGTTASVADVDAAEKIANQVYEQAKKGSSFPQLATEHKLEQMPLTQNWIAQSNAPAEWQKILPLLTHSGQVNPPVRIGSGFIILKAIGYQAPKELSFEQAKSKVTDAVKYQKAEKTFNELRETLTNLTYEHPDTLVPAAKALSLPLQVTGLFTKDQGDEGISSQAKVRDIAFSDDVLNAGNNSDVIQIDPDTIVVMRVKYHAPPSLLKLSEVESKIENKLKSLEIEQQALKIANENIQLAMTNPVPNFSLDFTKLGWTSRHDTKVDPAILQVAFNMPAPTSNRPTYATAKLKDGFAIVSVSGVKNGELTNKDESNVFLEQTQNTQGLLEYELYKDSLMKQAKITLAS